MLTFHDAHFSNSQILTVKQCIQFVIWKLDNIRNLDEQTFYRDNSLPQVHRDLSIFFTFLTVF